MYMINNHKIDICDSFFEYTGGKSIDTSTRTIRSNSFDNATNIFTRVTNSIVDATNRNVNI